MDGSRKKCIIIGVIAALILIVIVVLVIVVKVDNDSEVTDRHSAGTVMERVGRVLDRVPLIDGHNDLPFQLREKFRNQLSKVCFKIVLSSYKH